MVDFDGFLLSFTTLSCRRITTWPYAAVRVIEPGRQWQCHAQPHAAVAESPLPQSLLFLQYYLQNARTFTLPGDRVQWQWSRAKPFSTGLIGSGAQR